MYKNSPILIVSDSAVMRQLLRQSLIGFGYTQVAATLGATALDKLREMRPALVISDWNLQPLDGMELTKQVRADPELGATPLFIIVPSSNIENADAALQAGATDYLVIPISTPRLKYKLQKLLT